MAREPGEPEYRTRVRDLANGEKALPIPAQLRDKIQLFLVGKALVDVQQRRTEGGKLILEFTWRRKPE